MSKVVQRAPVADVPLVDNGHALFSWIQCVNLFDRVHLDHPRWAGDLGWELRQACEGQILGFQSQFTTEAGRHVDEP